jgi:hypothetical protein
MFWQCTKGLVCLFNSNPRHKHSLHLRRMVYLCQELSRAIIQAGTASSDSGYRTEWWRWRGKWKTKHHKTKLHKTSPCWEPTYINVALHRSSRTCARTIPLSFSKMLEWFSLLFSRLQGLEGRSTPGSKCTISGYSIQSFPQWTKFHVRCQYSRDVSYHSML